MKLHLLTRPALGVLAGVLLFATPSMAQSTAKEAADMLRALNIQIGEAQRAGNRERVSQLQARYLDIQRKWGVHPTDNRPAPPVDRPPRPWSSAEDGTGKILGYRGGRIAIRRASATLPAFWDGDRPNDNGRGAVVRFTDIDGNGYTYSGSWSNRGNRVVALRVTDERGGLFTGTLTMSRSGFSTITLIGEGKAEGISVSFTE